MAFFTKGRFMEVSNILKSRFEFCLDFTHFIHLHCKVCRTKDISLKSSLSKNSIDNGPRQRPKLNLTVKKELQGMGGQIMAQSKMAKVSSTQ